MRRWTIILTPLLLLSVIVSAAHGEDAFYRVALSDLKIIEGQAPAQPKDQANKWGYVSNPMQPYARLSGPGEIYIDFRSDWPMGWNQGQTFRTTLVARGEKGKDLRGVLYLPKPDWSGMARVGFEIPASAAAANSRRDFYAAKYKNYERLLKANLPGGPLFRREMEAAGREIGFAAAANPARNHVDDLAGTFALVS